LRCLWAGSVVFCETLFAAVISCKYIAENTLVAVKIRVA